MSPLLGQINSQQYLLTFKLTANTKKPSDNSAPMYTNGTTVTLPVPILRPLPQLRRLNLFVHLAPNKPELARTMSGSQTPDYPRSATFSPPPPADMTRAVPGNRQTELSRPLHLNIGHEGTNSVKSAQKEAVLSYVMAKTSPSGKIPSPGTLPPPYRSPNNSDHMSPTSAFRASIVDPNTAGPPPYRSPVDPPVVRNPTRLPRQNPPFTFCDDFR
jgi:hypothetical protein